MTDSKEYFAVEWGDEGFGLKSRGVLRRRGEAELARLKESLLEELFESHDPSVHGLLRRAANDAAALAWSMPSPALFLPNLMEEKVREALRYIERQKRILERFGTSVQRASLGDGFLGI